MKKQKNSNFQKHEEPDIDNALAPRYLLGSLRYDPTMIHELTQEYPESNLLDIIHFMEKLSTYYPESLINSIKNNSLNATQQQKLLEAQLRREQQF